MNDRPSNAHPSALAISDYSYQLPDARIAKYPLSQRATSKLLVYRDGEITEQVFKDLPSMLQANDCLVFNDTRVIHARIHFQRETGAQIEILCLEPMEPAEVSEAFANRKSTVWKAMVGNGKRWKTGELLSRRIASTTGDYQLRVELCGKETDAYVVRFSWDAELSFAEVLDDVGILPLPPYLNRDTEMEDEERYQTVYAQADGSVAAPTAGLHFTKEVFDELKEKGVQSLFVTLHVGAGTFKPVKSDTMHGHEMHKERILVSVTTIEKMRAAAADNRIIAVGTTSLRTIESIYWFGVKLLAGHKMEAFSVGQWDPYELADETVEVSEALDAVLLWLRKNELNYLNGYTQVLIAPGYRIRMADALITNFHQPQSTLLLLVAALIGPDWRRVYDHALQHDFRFLSFGDSSILFRNG
ncbi:MAG: S-adenosylmethionine:tRNA ribosyltransferase-isomerase [Flavobacteriales bacterium]|nr:S-adenosylmethionine:tRNA ribosyltransferase-isomerase [Flavobacteriales bacterium]